jgi:putative hydrolase of the HAD superfamily
MDSTVIFDLGRVLVRIHDDAILPSIAELTGTDVRSVAELLAGVEEPFETGRIHTEEALTRVLAGASGAGGRNDAVLRRRRRLLRATLAARFTPIWPVVELAYTLSARGYLLALASNTNPLDFDTVSRGYPDLLEPFGHRIFLSYRLGVMKPEPAFYSQVLAGLARPAEACVFIDDREENVEAARRLGMRGIVYNGTEAPVEDLAARLGV